MHSLICVLIFHNFFLVLFFEAFQKIRRDWACGLGELWQGLWQACSHRRCRRPEPSECSVSLIGFRNTWMMFLEMQVLFFASRYVVWMKF